MVGADDDGLVAAMRGTPFVEVSIFDPDATRVDQLRRQLDKAGIYGRMTVHQSSLSNLLLPPYLAHHLVVSPAQTKLLLADQRLLARLYESVRPYGGLMCLMTTDADAAKAALASAALANAKIDSIDGCVIVQRVGSLPGSGTWTHQYGNVANTIKSDDQLVKLPLGVLWYGGVSHEDVLPRHGHGPPEQVVGGRLFIEGMDTLTARDVYTAAFCGNASSVTSAHMMSTSMIRTRLHHWILLTTRCTFLVLTVVARTTSLQRIASTFSKSRLAMYWIQPLVKRWSTSSYRKRTRAHRANGAISVSWMMC